MICSVLASVKMIMEVVLSLALLFVGIAVLVVIHICVVGRAFRDGYPNGVNGRFPQEISFPAPRISIEDLQKLPRFEYRPGEKEKEKEQEKAGHLPAAECAVCLESFRAGDSCRLLPNCMHSFHSHCIDSWLLKTPVCPICRAAIKPPPSCRDLEEGEQRAPPVDVHVELT